MAKIKNRKKIEKLINAMVTQSFSSSGKLQEGKVENFARTLRSLSPSVAILTLSRYLEGLKRELRKNTLTIETPVELSKTEVDRAVKDVGGGREVRVKTVLNPSLLGGLRLKIGDMVWDDSVESKINRIKEAVIHV